MLLLLVSWGGLARRYVQLICGAIWGTTLLMRTPGGSSGQHHWGKRDCLFGWGKGGDVEVVAGMGVGELTVFDQQIQWMRLSLRRSGKRWRCRGVTCVVIMNNSTRGVGVAWLAGCAQSGSVDEGGGGGLKVIICTKIRQGIHIVVM